jgi:hypothetical protein
VIFYILYFNEDIGRVVGGGGGERVFSDMLSKGMVIC